MDVVKLASGAPEGGAETGPAYKHTGDAEELHVVSGKQRVVQHDEVHDQRENNSDCKTNQIHHFWLGLGLAGTWVSDFMFV